MSEGTTRAILSFIVGVIVGFLIFYKGCGTSNPNGSNKRDTVTVHRSTDSTIIEDPDPDTVLDTIRIVKKIPIEPDTVIIEDTSGGPEHTVNTTYEDSLLKAQVSTELKGEFLRQDLTYSLLSPKETIKSTDTLLIKDSVHTHSTKRIVKDPWTAGFGLEVEGSKTYFDLAPTVSLEKDGVQIKYEYNVLNKTHEIGVLKKIDLTK